MNKVWVTGDAVVDLIPDTESTYLKCPGGAPANVAVAIARLGEVCDEYATTVHKPVRITEYNKHGCNSKSHHIPGQQSI